MCAVSCRGVEVFGFRRLAFFVLFCFFVLLFCCFNSPPVSGNRDEAVDVQRSTFNHGRWGPRAKFHADKSSQKHVFVLSLQHYNR